MANDLVGPQDLAAFPGAPFSDEVVDAAVETLRGSAGWHIAPSRAETMTLDTEGGGRLILDTLRLTAVTAVRNTLGATTSPILGFRWSRAGVVAGNFPTGFQSVEVDVVHGFPTCPADLLPVIASLATGASTDAAISQETSGPFSVVRSDLSTLASWLDRSAGSVLARYTLPSRP